MLAMAHMYFPGHLAVKSIAFGHGQKPTLFYPTLHLAVSGEKHLVLYVPIGLYCEQMHAG